jgi:two-component system phosphate regulon sensor histidine kinase PhoR
MLWLILAALVLLGLAALWRQRSHAEQEYFQRLEGVLRAIADGEPPGSVVFSDEAGHFAKLTPLLDRIAVELGKLRAQASRDESRLETILASMQEGVMVVDAQHLLRTVNPSFLALFKVTRDPRGQSVLHTLRDPAFDELVTATLKSGEAQADEIELSGTKPRRFVSMHANPIRDETGGAGVVAIFRDITRLRQLEDVRREFVANVSHELRTPLSIFHGYLEMLTDTPDMPRPERLQVFEVLRRNSKRLNALLEDLLILARLESRHEEVACEPIAVPDFLHSTLKDWEPAVAEKKLTVEQEIAADLPTLHADRLRMEQVINNLLDNAVKYTEPGGRIAVRARGENGHLEFRIEDSGRGIPPADLPHIFERFYRADKARSREQGGTGLGLSIVKHIVQSHAGTVTAESTYAKGTTIVVRLPLNGGKNGPKG